MKIAYLILAHDQPLQLVRLINALAREKVVFYIHCDVRMNISKICGLIERDDVVFLEQRNKVNRSGYSLTLTTQKLIERAAKDNCDYYIFLSGRDYPIKDKNYIYNYLLNANGMNFINFYPLVGDADWVENIQTYDFVDSIAWVPKLFRKPANAFRYLIRKLLPKRKFLDGFVPYRGSSSWCLNRETINYMLNFLHSTDSEVFRRFFKSVHNSDEIYFQTIVLNSPFADQCRYYERDIVLSSNSMKNQNDAYLHYIDWNAHRENPAILDETDFDILKETDKLFARKFDLIKSKKLLNRIDSEILSSGSDI